MEYTIISAEDEKILIEKVNNFIGEGWETEGGVAVSPEGTFYQAMILFEDDDDDFDQEEIV